MKSFIHYKDGQTEFSFEQTGFSVVIQFVVKKKKTEQKVYQLPDTMIIQREVVVTEHYM